MTERQIEKIKQQIRSLRGKLTAEKKKYGGYDDSYGNRYMIAELYLKLGDQKATKRYYDWFAKEFGDDIGYPIFNLGWVKTLFENKKFKEAKQKLVALEEENIYFIEVILNRPVAELDKWDGSNDATLGFAIQLKADCQKLLTEPFKDWLLATIEAEDYQEMKGKLIYFQELLKDEEDYAKQSAIRSAESKLLKKWKDSFE